MYSSHRIRTSVSSSLLGLLLLLLSASVPIAAQRAPNATTILSVANGAGLKQLVKAIEAVGGPLLEAVSNSSTAVTVFAPTDEVSSWYMECWFRCKDPVRHEVILESLGTKMSLTNIYHCFFFNIKCPSLSRHSLPRSKL